MNFLNPLFLLGILAVAIPVIIHLINLRKPRKVYFSTLSFLNELKKSTIKRIKIKQYVLMAIRALAVCLLALALARPYLPPDISGASDPDTPKAIGIIIDNSPSMNRIGPDGPLIDQAREAAKSIIDHSNSSDRFMVGVTNGENKFLTPVSSTRAMHQVDEIESVNEGNFLDESVAYIYRQLQQAKENLAIIYLISDGQQSQLQKLNALELQSDQDSKKVAFQLIKLKGVRQQNLAITDIELKSRMLSKGSPAELRVEVTNLGEIHTENQFITLEVGGQILGQYQVSLSQGQSRFYTFEMMPERNGDLTGRIVLEGDEVPFDNVRHFVLRIPVSRKVLHLTDGENRADFTSYLEPALEAAGQATAELSFARSTLDETERSDFRDNDVIVMDGLKQVPEYWFEELQRYVQNGKGIIFLPSERGDIQNYNDFLDLFSAGKIINVRGEYASFRSLTTIKPLVEGHPVFDELFEKEREESISLDLPDMFYYYVYDEANNSGSYVLLRTETNDPVLVEQQFGEGKIMISTIGADPGWSNFPVNPLFAPLFYRTVLYAAATEKGGLREHVLGHAFEEEISTDRPISSVELQMGDMTAKPQLEGLPDGIRLKYDGKEWVPGILEIQAEEQKRLVAVNQDIMESDFNTLTDKELEKMLSKAVTVHRTVDAGTQSGQKLQEELSAAGFGKEIWNWFMWAALLLLVTETVISKLYRAENLS